MARIPDRWHVPVLADWMMNLAKPTLKPGNDAPRTGIYQQVGPRGGATDRVVHSDRGETMPPTQKPGQGYRPVRKS